jgi:hypothetical protein
LAQRRNFTLSPRSDFPEGWTPRFYFDTFHRRDGVNAMLSAADRAAYDDDCEQYVHTCEALMGSREKRARLKRIDRVAFAWAESETRAGRPPWGTPVPTAVLRAHGLIRPALTLERPREARSGARRRGGATSRGGASGDKPRPRADDDPPLEARPGRASGRALGGAR